MRETKENINLLSTEKEKVDNYIITSCITLIASFVIILSVKKPSNVYASYSYILSLFLLIISFLSSLWHKFRFPKRIILFEKARNKILKDVSGEIANFAENFALPAAKAYTFDNVIQSNEKIQKDPVPIRVEETFKEKTKDVIMVYLEKMSYELKDKSKEIFNKPLDEKHSRLKFIADYLSKKLRYIAFLIGLILFFVSILLTLLK